MSEDDDETQDDLIDDLIENLAADQGRTKKTASTTLTSSSSSLAVNFDSEAFKSLPAEMRYEVLSEVRERSKRQFVSNPYRSLPKVSLTFL